MRSITRRDFSRLTLATVATGAAPGFVAPGFARPAQRNEVAWLAEIQTAPDDLPSDAPQLRMVNREGQAFDDLDQWKRHRDAIRAKWLEFLGPAPAERKQQPKWKVLAEDRAAGVVRQRIRYDVLPGITTEAYLLRPEEAVGKLPGVAVFHSTVNHSIRQPAGVEGKPEKAFGWKLAQRGCVTICPRNYLWPTNDKIQAQPEAAKFLDRHPESKGMMRMLHDALVAVDLLVSLPEVDGTRIGSIGHSLGAKEVLYLAAFDRRVRVTISSEGGIGTSFSNWDAPWYLGEAIHSSGFQQDHHELLALAAPRPFLLIGGDSADGVQSWPYIKAALPIYRLYGEPARLGLFNHRQGHAVPPAAERRIYEWFDAYL